MYLHSSCLFIYGLFVSRFSCKSLTDLIHFSVFLVRIHPSVIHNHQCSHQRICSILPQVLIADRIDDSLRFALYPCSVLGHGFGIRGFHSGQSPDHRIRDIVEVICSLLFHNSRSQMCLRLFSSQGHRNGCVQLTAFIGTAAKFRYRISSQRQCAKTVLRCDLLLFSHGKPDRIRPVVFRLCRRPSLRIGSENMTLTCIIIPDGKLYSLHRLTG